MGLTSEDVYLIYENLPIAYQSLNSDGDLLYVNRMWLNALGYKKEEVIGKWFGNFVAEESLHFFTENFCRFKTNGQIVCCQLILVDSFGNKIHTSFSGNSNDIADKNGQNLHCIFEDISLLKEAENKLKKQNFKYQALYEKYESQLEEQKAVNDSLRESNLLIKENGLRLQLAIEASNLGLWDLKLEKMEVFLSQEYYKILEYHPSEFKPDFSNWMGEIHPEDKLLIEDLKYQLFTIGKLIEAVEYRVKSGRGKYKWLSLTSRVANHDKNGNPSRIVGTIKDISEKKESDIVIKESEEQYRNLFELSPYPIMVYSVEKTVLVNSAALKFFNAKSKSEILGKPLLKHIHPDFVENAKNRIKDLYARGGFTETVEEKFLSFTGEEKYVETIASAINYKGQKSIQIIFNDITERKRVEQKVKESEERYRRIFDTNVDCHFILDKDGSIIDANPSACKTYQYNLDELIGLSIFKLVLPEYHKVTNKLLQSIKTGETFEGETVDIRKNGKVFQTEVKGTSIQYQGQKHILGVTRDITGRKKAENALKESEFVLRRTQQIAKVGSYRSDLISRKTYWSDETIKIMGHNPADYNFDLDELEKKAIHPDDRSKFTDAYQSLLKDGIKTDNISFEYRVKHPDGKIRYISSTAKVAFDSKGRMTTVIGSAQDITDRKLAEIALKESEEKFRSFMETATDMMNIVDEDMKIIYANKAFYDNMEYAEDELIGMHVADLLKKDSKDIFFTPERHDELIATGKVNYEITWLTRSGKEIIGELRIVAIFDNDNNFAGSRGIFHDITERKKAEQELKNFNANLQSMIENTDDFIMIADRNGFPVLFNSNYKRKVEEMIGIEFTAGIKPHKHLNNPDEIELWDNIHEKVLSGEKFKVYFNMDLNGRTNYFEFSFYPVVDDNKVIGFSEHSRDITDLKEYENNLKLAKEQAEESDRLKSAFLANMSHEIRTPLNGILGFSQMLKEPIHSDEHKEEFINIINKSGNQLLNIITDILDISAIEAQQISIYNEKFNLNKLLDEIIDFFSSSSSFEKNKNIELRSNYCLDRESSEIVSDPGKLHIILNNLARNAFKFTSRGFIEIGYNIKDKHIEFFVKDTGIGIPTEKLGIIFERFRQADDSHTRKFGGTGLGLAIAKGYVEKLQGEIWVESEINRGSIFYFTVPYKPAQEKTIIKDHQHPDLSISWKNKTILIAEDEDMNFRLIEIVLKKYTPNIIRAKNGREAVELFKKFKINIILMDIKMPVMDGLEATIEIVKHDKTIPIIAQTAYALPEELKKLAHVGCVDYVTKPIRTKELVTKINNYIT